LPDQTRPLEPSATRSRPLQLAVLWIDWYAYHVARFEGLLGHPDLAGRVAGVEFVGGIGVHAGLKFREELPSHLPVDTLFPQASWGGVSKLSLARHVWNHLTKLDPAAVLVPGYYTLPAVTAALWAKAHHRVSILMTESTAFDHTRVAWKEWSKSLLLRTIFDAAVTGGCAHVRYLEQLHFPMDCVAGSYDVVNNAALAAAVAEARGLGSAAFGLPASPFFLYVGRLAPEKNVGTLLSAWIAYREAGGTWPLLLVGDGPSSQALQAQAKACSVAEDVFFPGLQGSRTLPRFYAFAGCFVLPSTREPWGLVVNEAMASGLPVLVSSLCGCAEDLVREGENGFTFDPASLHDLTRRLHQIASFSVETRKSLGTTSEQIINAYTPQRFGQEIAHLLNESGNRSLNRSHRTSSNATSLPIDLRLG